MKRDAEAYEEKISFFSSIAHEIKTPLTLIQAPLRKILAAGRLDESLAGDLQIIDSNAEYLDHLVKELLDFVRIEKRGYELVVKSIDIVERLGFLCFSFSVTAKAKNIRLLYRHDEDCIYIDADESALNKILHNLLHNAVKYAEGMIDVHIYRDGDMVCVTIRNDGPPIPQERRESIFEPFVCYDNDTRPYSRSFGIGLAMARNLVELHGGTLCLDDDPAYTKFTLHIPSGKVLPASPALDGENIDDYLRSSDRPLIAVVEDNRGLSSFLQDRLREVYRAVTFPSAEQAILFLKRHGADLLITDVALGAMSGVDLCKKVCQDAATSHIPVIILSAISSDDTKIECMDSGAAIYIEKPFNIDYLLSCIKNILEQQAKINSLREAALEGNLDIAGHDLPDTDREFLRRLDKTIMENLGNANFSNREMEELLYMSHTTLNRKMKELLDTTPNEYLRSKRLAVAAHMLETGNARISEICYAVGFSYPSYFTKCFKAKYGMQPAEYREAHTGK